jgi:hypothetical protein
MQTDEMRPGDIRSFKNGKGHRAVVLAIGLWAKRSGKHIRIDITGTGKHTTFTNDSQSVRYHRTLFRDLRQILIDNNCWEFEDEAVQSAGEDS